MPDRQVAEQDRDERSTAGPAAPAELVPVEAAAAAAAARRGQLDPACVLRLQRSIGNAAVGRILARTPELLDPSKDWDEIMAEHAAIGEEVRKRMIDTLSGKDRILFTSRLRALNTSERAALKDNAEFWTQLRKHLSGLAYWMVQLMVEYGDRKPTEVNALSAAIHTGDWGGARTLLMGYESLKAVPGLREVISSRFPKEQADDLRAILAETVNRAESGSHDFKEAHYKGGVMQRFEGDTRLRAGADLRHYAAGDRADPPVRGPGQHEDRDHRQGRSRAGRPGSRRLLEPQAPPAQRRQDARRLVRPRLRLPRRRGPPPGQGGARRQRNSNEHNWHAEDDGKVAAHEFGHMLGNPDEYDLPATAAEIPAAFGLSNAQGARADELGGPDRGEDRPRTPRATTSPLLMGAHYKSTSRSIVRYAQGHRSPRSTPSCGSPARRTGSPSHRREPAFLRRRRPAARRATRCCSSTRTGKAGT